MFDLDTIRVINMNEVQRQKRAASETETSRHCSWVTSGTHVILHSAKQRATVFLSPKQTAKFVARVKRCKTQDQIDTVVESFFS